MSKRPVEFSSWEEFSWGHRTRSSLSSIHSLESYPSIDCGCWCYQNTIMFRSFGHPVLSPVWEQSKRFGEPLPNLSRLVKMNTTYKLPLKIGLQKSSGPGSQISRRGSMNGLWVSDHYWRLKVNKPRILPLGTSWTKPSPEEIRLLLDGILDPESSSIRRPTETDQWGSRA